MKKIKLFSIFILQINFFGLVNGQGFVNSGEIFHIDNGASIFVDGDFQNNSGANFVNNGTVIITGNIRNSQIMPIPALGTWQFSGSTSQRFSGGAVLQVKNIIFNNPAGFTIGVPTTLKISGMATFQNGIFGPISSSYPLSFANGSSINTSPAPSNASFVNGTVLKEGIGSFTFPIGNSLIYQPIEANLATNTAGFLAKYNASNIGTGIFTTTGTDPTPLIGYNSSEYWDIGPVSGGTATGTVTLNWDGQNEMLNSGYSLRKVAHKIGANWLNEGTNATGLEGGGSVTSNLISSWSPFTVGYIQATALPITLISFSGKKVGETNQLNWQTSTEINASHFEIERNSPLAPGGGVSNGKFEKIGIVNANKAENYQFNDNSSLISHHSSLIFYRLKLVDLDGQFSYSKIIYLENTDNDQIVGNFYPNPAITNQSNIDINLSEKGSWSISTIDLLGKVLNTENRILEKGLNTLQFQYFQKGLNIIQFESNGKIVVRKVIR